MCRAHAPLRLCLFLCFSSTPSAFWVDSAEVSLALRRVYFKARPPSRCAVHHLKDDTSQSSKPKVHHLQFSESQDLALTIHPSSPRPARKSFIASERLVCLIPMHHLREIMRRKTPEIVAQHGGK